jgi:hypothetical protein
MTDKVVMTNGHILVIGGSGMLAGLCLRLASDGATVSVIARNQARMQTLADRAEPGHIVCVPTDYRDASLFDQALTAIADRHGRPERIFCWVHDEAAPGVSLRVAEYVTGTFWHILGSAAADPADPSRLSHWRARFRERKPGLDYRQIVLGFMLEGGRSRWLTNMEISDGVYTAAESTDTLSVIGTTDPWSRRP